MIVKSYLAERNQNWPEHKMFLFYGENLGLKFEFKENIKKNFNKAEIYNLNQDQIINAEEEAFANLFNISLFEKQKIFFINFCTDKILEFLEKIEKKLDDQKIFLFADQLEKRSKLRNFFEKSKTYIAIACYQDTEITIKNIILQKLKGYAGLSSDNINIILENCNLDRIKLNNEIEKIKIFFKKKEIDKENLQRLLNIKNTDDFNHIKDSAINGDKLSTNKLLNDTLIESEKNTFYLAVINQRLNKLKEARLLAKSSSLEDGVNMLKPAVFWKDKPIFLKQIKKWDSKKINKALNSTYDVELLIKSNSSIEKKFLIKKLLVDICNLANS